MMIQPEKKNKAILAYTTKTSRAVYHQKSKKLGFKSTSKMILQALDFLIKTLENGITMNKITAIDPKDPIWNGWQQKSETSKVKEKIKKSPMGLVMKDMKKALKDGFEFKKAEIKILTREEILKKSSKIKGQNGQVIIYYERKEDIAPGGLTS